MYEIWWSDSGTGEEIVWETNDVIAAGILFDYLFAFCRKMNDMTFMVNFECWIEFDGELIYS